MRFAFCLLLVFATETSRLAVGAENTKDKPFLASVDYCLTQQEVAKYSAEAMAGSGDAADKLANAYWMCIRLHNQEKTKYWALIGAENGNIESQFRAYQTLSTSADSLDQERALFWLKRAAQQNYRGAPEILQNCSSVSAKRPRGAPCFGPGSGH